MLCARTPRGQGAPQATSFYFAFDRWLCYFFSLLAHRRVGGAQADFCVYTAEGTDWPQATLWWSRRASLLAAGQPLARTDSWPLWNFQWESARWLPVSTPLPSNESLLTILLYLTPLVCVCVCSSPAGMIEGTPQLHATAWKVSSACVTPVNLPIIDPCETNQNNGNEQWWILFLFVFFETRAVHSDNSWLKLYCSCKYSTCDMFGVEAPTSWLPAAG